MPISVRLKPELEKQLAAAARRERKSRSAIIHEALTARFAPVRPPLGEAVRRALAAAPGGFGIERDQPSVAEPRAWKR
jgi:predicted transcriptional regulator